MSNAGSKTVFRVITVEREYGSGGARVAELLAQRRGWQLWDKRITEVIAARLKCNVHAVSAREERDDSTFHRLVKAFMRGSYEDSYAGKGLDVLDAEQLATLFEHVIVGAATEGSCVIVGRGAPWFLRSRSDTFRLFVYGGHEQKVQRVMRTGGKSRDEAEELVTRVDRERAAFITRYYHKTWPQRDLYHLMANSNEGEDAVVDLVEHEMELLERRSLHATTA
jgi:hypothetical protein